MTPQQLVVSWVGLSIATGCSTGASQRVTTSTTSSSALPCDTSAASNSEPTGSAPTPVKSSPGGALEVYDGATASASTFPFVGFLFYATNTEEGICTASLICPDVVLSAAHCFFAAGPATNAANENAPLADYRFSLGTAAPLNGARSDLESLPSDATSAVKVAVNPGWQGAGEGIFSSNDMAILKLAHPLAAPLASLNFTTIAVPSSNAGIPATAVGYGQSEQNGGDHDQTYGAGTKRQGALTFMGEVNTGHTTYPGTLATLRGPSGQEICEGDSGGPLLIKGSVYGVASAGAKGCGLPAGPAGSATADNGVNLYSSVPFNATWIKAQMLSMCGTLTPTQLHATPAATAKGTSTTPASHAPTPCAIK